MARIRRRLSPVASAELAGALRGYASERSCPRTPRWRVVSKVAGCSRNAAYRILRGDFVRLSAWMAQNTEENTGIALRCSRPRAAPTRPSFPVWDRNDGPIIATQKAMSMAGMLNTIAHADYGLLSQVSVRRHMTSGHPLLIEMLFTIPGKLAAVRIAVTEMTGNGTRLAYWGTDGELQSDCLLDMEVVTKVFAHAAVKLRAGRPETKAS